MNYLQRKLGVANMVTAPMHAPAPMTVQMLSDLMGRFWHEVKHEHREVPAAMAEGLCDVINSMIDARLEHWAGMPDEDAEKKNEKYYHALEAMRSVSGLAEKQRIMNEHFTNLTENEKKVLMHKANQKPKALLAKELGMTKDEYCEARRSMMTKAH